MTTYILVHGAWHGGWCWDRLVAELHARGDDTIVMDLPIEDGTRTFTDYASVVVDAAAGAPDDAVIVGHSMGSMVIPLVAAARPVSAMVFLCGLIPKLGAASPWDGAPEMTPDNVFAVEQRDDRSTVWTSVVAARRAFYESATEADAAWAFERLRPGNGRSLFDTPYPLDDWPPGRRIAIVTTEDRAVCIEFSRYVSEERLGVTPIELPGDHSPFLSQPAALADAMTAALQMP